MHKDKIMEQRGSPRGQGPSRIKYSACRKARAGLWDKTHAARRSPGGMRFVLIQVCRSVLIFVVEISGVRGR